MNRQQQTVGFWRGYRVTGDTLRSRFRWLVAVSVLLHLVLTPIAGLVGLAALLFEKPPAPPPLEELDAIPIEFLEEPGPSAEVPEPSALPEEDPLDVIEELIAVPEAREAPKAEPHSEKPKPEPSEQTETDGSEPLEDAGVPDQAASDEPEGEISGPEEARSEPREVDTSEAPEAVATPALADAGPPPRAEAKQPREPIGSPVAMLGKAGELVQSNANLQLVLHTDRIREHPVGKRIGAILPKLPQWHDFFGSGELEPVRDFDRLLVAGPSFYYSEQLFVALEYNVPRRVVHAAVDRLVQRPGGKWLEGTPVPAAIAVADRAQRLFVVPERQQVFVAPPKLRAQVLGLANQRLPRARGGEAMVATIKQPAKSFWQLRLDIPETVRDARIRISALPEGAVSIEVQAYESDAAAAERAAQRIALDVNAKLELLSGVSNVLNRLGFGGLTRGMNLPRLELRHKGSEIFGTMTLNAEQVAFVLDRVERQVALLGAAESRPAPAGSVTSGAPNSGTAPPPRLPAPRR